MLIASKPTIEQFIQKLRETTDSINPHFAYKDIPIYISSKCPPDTIYFITPETHLEIKNMEL